VAAPFQMAIVKAIAAKILEQESDDVLSVKNNQPTLVGTVDRFFDEAERTGWDGVPRTQAERLNKDHGRIETRQCVVVDNRDGFMNPKEW
jgi:hypothetical protein